MKKRALSIFLLSILVISCFLYVFPLTSLAYVSFDNYIAWDIVSGNLNSNILNSNSDVYFNSYSYDTSTGWTALTYPGTTNKMTQLPSPFKSQDNVTITFSESQGINMSSQNSSRTVLSFDFSGRFSDYVEQLSPKSGDFICFAQLINTKYELNHVSFKFGHIVSGNAFEPYIEIDDRFLVYNPYNVSGMTTSGIINTSLWDFPVYSFCSVLFYFNILYDDLLNFPNYSDLDAITISFDFINPSGSTNGYSWKPILYKASLDGDIQTIEYLSSIDNNVQILSDAVQSHVAPPTNYTDFSGVDQAEAQVSSKVNTIKNTLDDWALTSYISTGLSWVGAYTSYYFNEFGFIQAIYGIIVFFAIANVLRHGFFRTQRDYVTTDNYSFKGHNTQGDYEITGTRTTRRE